MVNDKILHEFLKSTQVIQTRPMTITAIGNQGEHMLNWQMHFNHLSVTEMYNAYKSVVTQLMYAEMSEELRLSTMDKVLKVSAYLVARLHPIYRNQTGFLEESQQQALDTVLSMRYLAIMFYHSVWQRVAVEPIVEEKKGLSNLFGLRGNETSQDSLIQTCLYAMLSLLREALFEKYIGYRTDIEVLWRYLNGSYSMMKSYGWQSVKAELNSLYAGKYAPTMQEIYYQCLLAHTINPYACRRPDLLAFYEKSASWTSVLEVSSEGAEKPFLFVNLDSDEPPKLFHTGLSFNPFSKENDCLFINVMPLQQRLMQVLEKGRTSDDSDDKIAARRAQIVLDNLEYVLQTPTEFTPTQQQCQVVVGFHQIHYMLANKTSLGNLIQAHTLPERIRPRVQPSQQLNKSTTVNIIGMTLNERHLAHQFSYQPFEQVAHSQLNRSSDYTAISQFQVQSLIALRHVDDPNKSWKLGRVGMIQQQKVAKNNDNGATGLGNRMPTRTQMSQNVTADSIDLSVQAWVRLFGENIVPCAVRLQNSGNRPAYFVPALIIPKNILFKRSQTTIMMARFGYNVDDKLVIRIDSKEVNICLIELVNLTDDIEEYAFNRLQM